MSNGALSVNRQLIASLDVPTFSGELVAFEPNPHSEREKILFLITSNNELAQVWNTERWNIDFPAKNVGKNDIKFKNSPRGFTTAFNPAKKSIYLITDDGRLAQIWDTDKWNIDFPAEQISNYTPPKFQGTPKALPIFLDLYDKVILAVTEDGRLAQIWDENKKLWKIVFPVEQITNCENLRFKGSVEAFITDRQHNRKLICAVTNSGELAQISDNDFSWNIDFPCQLAGASDLRFQANPVMFRIDEDRLNKSVYAFTEDGRLAQISDYGDAWQVDFPAELAGRNELRFHGQPAVMQINGANKKSIYALTTDGRLTQITDYEGVWKVDFPAELAGKDELRFCGSPAVVRSDTRYNKKFIYAVTMTGVLCQIWDTDQWNIDFPLS